MFRDRETGAKGQKDIVQSSVGLKGDEEKGQRLCKRLHFAEDRSYSVFNWVGTNSNCPLGICVLQVPTQNLCLIRFIRICRFSKNTCLMSYKGAFSSEDSLMRDTVWS